MPTPKSPRAKAASAPRPEPAPAPSRSRAPFGFIFFFLLLTATFVFSTFYVISQTAREDALRRESAQDSLQIQGRLNALQTQVNVLSAQVADQQDRLQRLEPGTRATTTLPTAAPTRR